MPNGAMPSRPRSSATRSSVAAFEGFGYGNGRCPLLRVDRERLGGGAGCNFRQRRSSLPARLLFGASVTDTAHGKRIASAGENRASNSGFRCYHEVRSARFSHLITQVVHRVFLEEGAAVGRSHIFAGLIGPIDDYDLCAPLVERCHRASA